MILMLSFIKSLTFAITRQLHTSKSQDYVRDACHTVSYMDHDINFLLETCESMTNIVFLQVITMIIGIQEFFELKHFCADFTEDVECYIDVNDVSKLNKRF